MRSLIVPLNPHVAVAVRSSGVKSVPTLKHFPIENQVGHEPQNIVPLDTALSIFCPLIIPYEVEHYVSIKCTGLIVILTTVCSWNASTSRKYTLLGILFLGNGHI